MPRSPRPAGENDPTTLHPTTIHATTDQHTAGGPADPGRYGRSFAEVYDEWYPGGDEDLVVSTVQRYAGPGSRIIELGVGTGRLALPLAAAGHHVVGMESSNEMLGRLGAKDPAGSVEAHLGDAGSPGQWPAGPFDVVLAACNVLVNLPSADSQRACIAAAAAALRPGGHLFVEIALMTPPDGDKGALEVRSVEPGRVVLIATETDASTGRVEGNHIEMRDGAPLRVRPWTVRILRLEELDEWCTVSGFTLSERQADWAGSPFTDVSTHVLSVYERNHLRTSSGHVAQ